MKENVKCTGLNPCLAYCHSICFFVCNLDPLGFSTRLRGHSVLDFGMASLAVRVRQHSLASDGTSPFPFYGTEGRATSAAPLHVKGQQLYSELLPGDRAGNSSCPGSSARAGTHIDGKFCRLTSSPLIKLLHPIPVVAATVSESRILREQTFERTRCSVDGSHSHSLCHSPIRT